MPRSGSALLAATMKVEDAEVTVTKVEEAGQDFEILKWTVV